MRKIRLDRVKSFLAMLKTRFLQKSRRNLRLSAVMLIVCVFSAVVYASVSMNMFSTTIGSRGAVKTLGVGVYWDVGCNNPVSSIDWGVVDPGSRENVTVYVRNEANVPAVISLSTENWDPPEASSYMTLGWDYSGQTLEPGESIGVTLTLSISSDIQDVTEFDFDIVIAVVG